MILSLPEIEFEVMSVSSSIAPSVAACASAQLPRVSCSTRRAPRVFTASLRMRAMMFIGSRNQNT